MVMFMTLCECVKSKIRRGRKVRDEEGEMGKEYSGNEMNPSNNLAISDSDTRLLLLDIDRVMERGFVSLVVHTKVNQVSSWSHIFSMFFFF